jgi:hypothetical protein
MMKIIDKESSLWGWSRIMAALTAFASFGAIALGQPDAAPDITDIATSGTAVIDAAYLLYAKVGLLVSACLAAYSKVRSLFP